MKGLPATLSKKDLQRHAKSGAAKLANGGMRTISGLSTWMPRPVRQGLTALELADDPVQSQVQKKAADARS